MKGLLEQFAKLPVAIKLVTGGGLIVVQLLLFYFVFYSSLSSEKDSLDARIRSLEEEKATYEVRVQDYLAFRSEVAKLLDEQKDLFRVLPRDAQIPAFLQQLDQQSELVGVDVLEFQRKPDAKHEFFAEIPVFMRISGPFHRVTKFFRNVGELKRIVNVHGLSLTGGGDHRGAVLSASFTASTFRFREQEGDALADPAAEH